MTHQEDKWVGDFGQAYSRRNPQCAWDMDVLYNGTYGRSRSSLNWEFLAQTDLLQSPGIQKVRILEPGCGLGCQLELLREMGFENLYGVDLQSHPGGIANLVRGSVLDLPFRDGWFDLVFTSGLLIHVAPVDIPRAILEIHRCSRHWIWGMEYYAGELTEINYRGEKNMLWKGPYSRMFLKFQPDLELVHEVTLPHVGEPEAQDRMFLLRKKQ